MMESGFITGRPAREIEPFHEQRAEAAHRAVSRRPDADDPAADYYDIIFFHLLPPMILVSIALTT